MSKSASARRGALWGHVQASQVHGPQRAKSPGPNARGVQAFLQAIATAADPNDGSAWERIKNEIVAERGPACEVCPTVMPDAGLVHLHHITPRSKGGPDERANATLICPNCHARAHWLYRQLADALPVGRDEFFSLLKRSA